MHHSIGPLTLPGTCLNVPLDDEEPTVRRAATALLTAALTSAGLAAMAPAAAAHIVARDLTITVTDLGPEKRTCHIDADLPELARLGVAQVFTPGATTEEIVSWVREHVGAV